MALFLSRSFYVNVPTAEMAENMSSAEREIETGTFAALATGLTALDHPSPWDRLRYRIPVPLRRDSIQAA